MGVILFLLLLAVPLAELWLIVQVAGGIGLLNTVVLLLVISAVGAWLLKQQGVATWKRLQKTLSRGEMPTQEVTDGALILLGGALLMTPGFLTDIVGLILLLPPTRATIKGASRSALGRWAGRRLRANKRIRTTRVVRVERRSGGTTPTRSPSPRDREGRQLPHSPGPEAEDDSPGNR